MADDGDVQEDDDDLDFEECENALAQAKTTVTLTVQPRLYSKKYTTN